MAKNMAPMAKHNAPKRPKAKAHPGDIHLPPPPTLRGPTMQELAAEQNYDPSLARNKPGGYGKKR